MIDATRPLDPIPFRSAAWWTLRDRVAGVSARDVDAPCEMCGEPFAATAPNQVYCGPRCAHDAAAMRRRHTRAAEALARQQRRAERRVAA